MIVITGASSGLGAALANLYHQEGESLLITGRDKIRLFDVANSLDTTPEKSKVLAKTANLTDSVEVEALFDMCELQPSTIIHCAGSGYFGSIEEQDPEMIKRLMDNNVTSSIMLLREAVKRYREHPVTVVVVMSTAALMAKGGESTYCAAKWAVRGLVESVRLELKSINSPMKIISVYPGGMATAFWTTSGKALDTSSFMTAKEAALMLKQALVTTEHGYVSDLTINRG
ncbi:short-chain dehydrogenase [Shewanella hanedai]|uniref:SDR family NAD(P)-dependent oxidoreductase n=1 Tax=Shewanella hanedai TaxID=25 RepID=A0A553JRB3_SHEHA|nr:SDR family NAD(P)-dependent oxidoreductase [Shewanella hanedai]TRY15003.1 SDR family NAD(P)-dependent oxidoreductase [Shewanella hanedai]GGI75744.1 short-chain dehydrogenase [Shewanella hanedai]